MADIVLNFDEYLDRFPGHNRVWTEGRYINRPYLRHIAKISQITHPAGRFEKAALIVTGDVAVTLCGKFLRNYWHDRDGEKTADTYTDGLPYLVDCPTCANLAYEATHRHPATRGTLVP